MKDVVLDEVINEKSYQQAKKKMCKEDDYFTINELKELKKVVVILS